MVSYLKPTYEATYEATYEPLPSSEVLRFFDLSDLLFDLIQHLFHAPLSSKTHWVCKVPNGSGRRFYRRVERSL